MKTTNITSFTLLMISCLLVACGKSTSTHRNSEGSVNGRENLAPDGSNINGLYKATFTTLNPHVNGTIPGGATFLRKGDRLYAYVRLFAGGPRVWHQQNVYIGNRCPTLNDDLNKDGYIDILEAKQVLGQILVPLDSDVGTQSAGKRYFPLSDLSGSYSYERIASFNRFFKDLQDEDHDTEDDITKIAPNSGFSFIGKSVMIQGVSDKIIFPETVATFGKKKVFQTLPIVCGIFSATDAIVGESMTQSIPGPVAPVVDGQDTPAPPGAGEYYPPDPQAERGNGTNTNTEGETTDGSSPRINRGYR